MKLSYDTFIRIGSANSKDQPISEAPANRGIWCFPLSLVDEGFLFPEKRKSENQNKYKNYKKIKYKGDLWISDLYQEPVVIEFFERNAIQIVGKEYRTWYKVDFPTYKKILKWYKKYYLPSRIQPLECDIIEKRKIPIQILSVVRKRIYGKLGWERHYYIKYKDLESKREYLLKTDSNYFSPKYDYEYYSGIYLPTFPAEKKENIDNLKIKERYILIELKCRIHKNYMIKILPYSKQAKLDIKYCLKEEKLKLDKVGFEVFIENY